MVISNTDIFQTVPRKDHLDFFHNNRLQSKGVVDFLNLKKEDVSRATGIPSASVRYDEKMPEELRERINEWAILLNLVAEHFKGDAHRTTSWFTMTNPLLGNISPRDMIRLGRYKKLVKFIMNAIAENKP